MFEYAAAATLGLAGVFFVLSKQRKRNRVAVPTVLVFPCSPVVPDLPNLSPFCLRLQALLAAARVPHEVKRTNSFHPKTGKLPAMVFPEGEESVADSQLCLERLVADDLPCPKGNAFGIDSLAQLDDHLDAEALALGNAVDVLCSRSLYNWTTALRWKDHAYLARHFFFTIPALIRGPIVAMIARGVVKNLWERDVTRISPEAQLAAAKRDLDSAAVMLGDDEFLFGAERLSSYDITLYSFIVQYLHSGLEDVADPAGATLVAYAKSKKNLVRHAKRVHALCFETEIA